jgi:hypothetical protein
MRLLSLLLLLTLASPAFATEEDSPFICSPEGVALGGYDAVSYRQPDGPILGSDEFASKQEVLTYRFANAENLKLFLADPESYLPRYHGWCAATLSMGRLACPDYTNFKIEDGSLLLFELVGFTNGRTMWNSDPVGFRTRADANALELFK